MNAFTVVTVPGGASTDDSPLNGVEVGYSNPYHKDGGHYSIDVKPIDSEAKANVIAGMAGRVIHTCENYECEFGYGPVIVIYHGKGYYTKLQEFSMGNEFLVKPGDFVESGQKIGEYNAPRPKGLALHFQVKYDQSYTESCSTRTECPELKKISTKILSKAANSSSKDIAQLGLVELAGVRLGDYRLRYLHLDESGNAVQPAGGDAAGASGEEISMSALSPLASAEAGAAAAVPTMDFVSFLGGPLRRSDLQDGSMLLTEMHPYSAAQAATDVPEPPAKMLFLVGLMALLYARGKWPSRPGAGSQLG